MFFKIDLRSGEPVYRQIIKKIQGFIVSGELKEHQILPSVRQLALVLGVNPNTVNKAYRELCRKQVLYVRPGSGYFVCPIEAKESVQLEQSLEEWLVEARLKGLTESDVSALFKKMMQGIFTQEVK